MAAIRPGSPTQRSTPEPQPEITPRTAQYIIPVLCRAKQSQNTLHNQKQNPSMITDGGTPQIHPNTNMHTHLPTHAAPPAHSSTGFHRQGSGGSLHSVWYCTGCVHTAAGHVLPLPCGGAAAPGPLILPAHTAAGRPVCTHQHLLVLVALGCVCVAPAVLPTSLRMCL